MHTDKPNTILEVTNSPGDHGILDLEEVTTNVDVSIERALCAYSWYVYPGMQQNMRPMLVQLDTSHTQTSEKGFINLICFTG
jgi:hypothetical protein